MSQVYNIITIAVHFHNGKSFKTFLPLTLVVHVVIANINGTMNYEFRLS